MSEGSLKLTLQDLNLAGREIPLPVDVFLEDGSFLTIEKVLRLLPGKRVTVQALWHKKTVLAKIYFQKGKASSGAKNENRGYMALKKAGITTPERLDWIKEKNAQLFLYEFIPEAESLADLLLRDSAAAEHSNYLRMVITTTVKLHDSGLLQEDLHFDNFLYWLGELYVIDVASIRAPEKHQPIGEQRALDNLGLLWAQLPASEHSLSQAYFTLYCAKRGWLASETLRLRFDAAIGSAWQGRKQNYLRKQFRDCSETLHIRRFDCELLCKRTRFNPALQQVLEAPDTFIEKGTLLKDGGASTVARISLDNESWVIKRYNNKNPLKTLKRLLQKSRAEHNWYCAHLLQFIGIPTPPPVAIRVNRFGPLRSISYFICDAIDGDNAFNVFTRNTPDMDMVEQIVNLFEQLAANGIVHGDCKSTNFIIDDHQPWLTDLDGMRDKQHQGFEKDRERFLRDWQKHPVLLELFTQHFKHAGVMP